MPAYRNLTLPLKAFAVTSVTTASLIVGADSAARKYELSKYALGSGTQLEKITHHDIAAEEAAGIGAVTKTLADTKEMTTKDLVLSWGKEHRYSVVFGALVYDFHRCLRERLTLSQQMGSVDGRLLRLYLNDTFVLCPEAGSSAHWSLWKFHFLC